ncbi:hypothetical protein Igni_1308 [Ignicoccus hospitalis KIN4/I]|uniref:Uncharacterized protein n=1 Tax=Ignicoccus hospitalis (strain KIN4/I / DSM 18386 / JCM 14125) TaxID=453591 RepID=A8AC32_IGNH4|nr:hypothetical protein Igni_1308 [Ignicoccus hospitalis KIN4/I]
MYRRVLKTQIYPSALNRGWTTLSSATNASDDAANVFTRTSSPPRMENIQMRIGKKHLSKYPLIKTFIKPPTTNHSEAEKIANNLREVDVDSLESVLTNLWPKEESRRKESSFVRMVQLLSIISGLAALVRLISTSTPPNSPLRQEAEGLYREVEALKESILNVIISCEHSKTVAEVIFSIRRLTDALKEFDEEALKRFAMKELGKKSQNVVGIRISSISCDEMGVKIDLPKELGEIVAKTKELMIAMGSKPRGLKTKLLESSILSFSEAKLPDESWSERPEAFVKEFFERVEERSKVYVESLFKN